MLAYATFTHAKVDRIYLLLALGTELALGIGGYFSDFKTVLFFTFLALVAAGIRVSVARAIGSFRAHCGDIIRGNNLDCGEKGLSQLCQRR